MCTLLIPRHTTGNIPNNMETRDIHAIIAGSVAWAAAVLPVMWVGPLTANGGNTGKVVALVVGVGIAAVTTPLVSSIMGWQTREQRIRGIALALGTAQTIDGIVSAFLALKCVATFSNSFESQPFATHASCPIESNLFVLTASQSATSA